MFGFSNKTAKTFRVRKTEAGTKHYQLRQYAEATLGSGSLMEAVKLPKGEDLNEWIAMNTMDFYTQINMLYGTITEFCTAASCPQMNAGPSYEYYWQDDKIYTKPTRMSAPDYINNLLDWTQEKLDDKKLFPTEIGVEFPKNFRKVIQQIFRRLFRIYAHIYCSHFHVMVAMELESYLNTSFKHFVFFCREFGLMDNKEYAPMQDLVDSMV
ncbi:Maintenance of ploidy protein mob1 [Schizosaccharomyces pombe]|uniref:Maintenance of ploidy protein mob1 n=1 Tax=Schizosaccharomyces pombe (strain 972 / ATCC 24843) TaxID=284812 RepID=MOB1_SCHPO|nr:Sid2-Mob1 kinase complex regulatory subunit Mob1 [Schizosaccharomyces pombe]O94360.1 RecName: Full=Maintenance of ploidy protein mob1 [Schizosaccharomyces pombe 972h-]CAA22288.1 Sid2-Mob1 kinase complex regulatory subunit Mob1 [Schizosaccharomyces pombe]|eukprot:NP_595191.1 Sid2-Mob1 kinase complex regulatory subunit Mob1 [Schizosaccharomyces pombe]